MIRFSDLRYLLPPARRPHQNGGQIRPELRKLTGQGRVFEKRILSKKLKIKILDKKQPGGGAGFFSKKFWQG